MAAYWGLILWFPMGSMMIHGAGIWIPSMACAEQHLRIPSSSHDAAQPDVSSKRVGTRAPPVRIAHEPMVEAGGHCDLHRFRRFTVAGHLWNLDNSLGFWDVNFAGSVSGTCQQHLSLTWSHRWYMMLLRSMIYDHYLLFS